MTSAILPKISPRDRERFMHLVDRRGAQECWPWKGAGSKSGHGRFGMSGKLYYAHTVALWMSGQASKAGAAAKNKCGHRNCVNPSHWHWPEPARLVSMSAYVVMDIKALLTAIREDQPVDAVKALARKVAVQLD